MFYNRLAAPAGALSVAVLAVLATVAMPTTAIAATDAPALTELTAIVGVGSTGQGTLIVKGTLPSSVTLPARIIVPIPAGLKPDWVGEIVGTDPAKDPTAKYAIKSGQKYDVITVELNSSRTGQVEFSTALPVADGGTLYSLDLPVLSKVGLATLSFQVPSGSTVASVSAGVTLQQSAGGTDLYSITKSNPSVGKTLSAGLTVPAPAGAAAETLRSSTNGGSGTSGGSSISQMVALLAAALAGFGLVTLVAYIKDKRASEI